MDMRTLSKADKRQEAGTKSQRVSNDHANKLSYSGRNNNCTGTSFAHPRESSSDSAGSVSMRGNTESTAHKSSSLTPGSGTYDYGSPKPGSEEHGSEYISGTYTDVALLPIIDLIEKSGEEKKEHGVFDDGLSTQNNSIVKDENGHSFQINNNVDFFEMSNVSVSNNNSYVTDSEIQMVCSDVHEPVLQSNNLRLDKEINRLRISNIPETSILGANRSQRGATSKDRVSEWLWTLHQIGISVCPFFFLINIPVYHLFLYNDET